MLYILCPCCAYIYSWEGIWFKHVTYTLLISAYLQPEQYNCDQTGVSPSSRLSLCACTCVRAHVCAWRHSVIITEMQSWHTVRAAKVSHVEKQKLMCFLWKCSWFCSYFNQGVPFCMHLEWYVIAFLIEFHVLVTGGWTNPQKMACNTESLTHFEYGCYHTESAHTQLKGYETSWVKLSKLLTSPR